MINNLVKIYVELLDEGSPTLRLTNAEALGNNLFKLLPADNYDAEDETWQFLPGTTVKGEKKMNGKNEILFASAKA